jgi:hypothetical protein
LEQLLIDDPEPGRKPAARRNDQHPLGPFGLAGVRDAWRRENADGAQQ